MPAAPAPPHMRNADGVAIVAVTVLFAWLVLVTALDAWSDPVQLVWYGLALLVGGAVLAAEAVLGDPQGTA